MEKEMEHDMETGSTHSILLLREFGIQGTF